MSGGEVGLLMISLFILTVLLGFPIVFTLMGMGVSFGYYAYATPTRSTTSSTTASSTSWCRIPSAFSATTR